MRRAGRRGDENRGGEGGEGAEKEGRGEGRIESRGKSAVAPDLIETMVHARNPFLVIIYIGIL